MKILLVSATEFEISPLLRQRNFFLSKEALTSYGFGMHSVDVLITGVGMTATAFHMGRCLNKKYDLALNAGVAGSFRKRIPLGTVVNVADDCFADIGAQNGDKFLTLKEMGLDQEIKFMSSITGRQSPVIGRLKKVKGITVNTVHGNELSIRRIIKKFNPDVESMEGAAFFFACNYFKIPCIQVRAVSNYVERRNKRNWKLNLAIDNLNACLEQLLPAI